MNTVLAGLTQLLTHYGYPALFSLLTLGIVGLPVPDETLLTFCGYLIFRGRLNFGLTFLAGFLGSACGISISYFLGARFGATALTRFGKYVGMTQGRAARTERMFQRFGPMLLTIGYFIPGVRHFTAVVAGMSGVRSGKFALFAYSGAALWVGTFLMLGYFLGDGWQRGSEVVHHYIVVAMGIGIALLLVMWLGRMVGNSCSREGL